LDGCLGLSSYRSTGQPRAAVPTCFFWANEMKTAEYWIQKLGLEAHPEGGYYRQTYKSDLVLAKGSLPAEFTGARAASTAIYFLLRGEEFSAFHRLRSDEVWHFYVGSTLVVHVIDEGGRYSEILLGSDPECGEVLQAVVKAGSWFGSRVGDGSGFALVGCTVAPGFEFEDFEMGKREELVREYPEHRAVIEGLTRG
jgi:predicted cupin superfamily sugar epimerase